MLGTLLSWALSPTLHGKRKPLNKLDNSGYKFRGRSYGVASTVGLVPDPSLKGAISSGSLQTFGYKEPGYHSSVTCIYNNTSDLSLEQIGYFETPDGIYHPTVFWANGALPTGTWDGYPTWAVLHNGTVTAIAAVANSSHYMYGFAVGYWSEDLNHIQCEVKFSPMLFSIEVDAKSQIITAEAVGIINDTTSTMDHVSLDESVIQTAFYGPSYLAQTLTTMYVNTLAKAFKVNINNISMRNNHTNATTDDYLIGVAEGLEVLLDHVLGSTGAAQIKLAGDPQLVPANIVIQVMQIGEAKYTYSIFAISVAIFMLIIADALRTQFWKMSPLFNSLDLKSAILGVASTTGDFELIAKHWDGDAANRKMGMLRVMLLKEQPVLLLTGLTRYGRKSNINSSRDSAVPLLNIGSRVSNNTL
ncbi:MAG: hypothetical protein Q9187_002295 [Circinaria calcarea]